MLRLIWFETAVDLDVDRYLSLVGFTLLYYDYLLTVYAEFSRFWSPFQLNWGTVVFILNRYVSIFGHVPVIIEFFIPGRGDDTMCCSLQDYHQYLAIVIQAIVGAVMITRIYALYSRSRTMLACLLTLGAATIAWGGYCVSIKSPDEKIDLPPGIIGCAIATSRQGAMHLAAAWSGVLVFDSFIFASTLYKTVKIGRTTRRTLVDVLLRDGVMYFGVLGISVLANVLSFLFGDAITRGIATTITNVLATTCASRLMLNIRDPKIQWVSPGTTMNTTPSSVPFISTVVDLEPSTAVEVRDGDGIELAPRMAASRVKFAV